MRKYVTAFRKISKFHAQETWVVHYAGAYFFVDFIGKMLKKPVFPDFS